MKRSHSDDNINWNLCFIFQDDFKKLCSTPTGIQTLAENLLEFYRLSTIDDLIIKTQNNLTTACFTKTIDDLYRDHYNNPDSFIKQLCSIVTPIRNDIFRRENNFKGYFDEDS